MYPEDKVCKICGLSLFDSHEPTDLAAIECGHIFYSKCISKSKRDQLAEGGKRVVCPVCGTPFDEKGSHHPTLGDSDDELSSTSYISEVLEAPETTSEEELSTATADSELAPEFEEPGWMTSGEITAPDVQILSWKGLAMYLAIVLLGYILRVVALYIRGKLSRNEC